MSDKWKFFLLLGVIAIASWLFWVTQIKPAQESALTEDSTLTEDSADTYLIILDPGHGGGDPGAEYGGAQEKNINLAVALKVLELLEEQENLRIQMTRQKDESVDLYDRAAMANEAGADLFVSLHSNALDDDSYEGIMTFYWNSQSKTAAETLQNAVIAQTNAIDRGVRTEEYVVVRETKMPAALIEMGFMTCPDELARMTDPAYQDKLAQGIADGILALFSENRK